MNSRHESFFDGIGWIGVVPVAFIGYAVLCGYILDWLGL